jgi:serine/threonine-protein kinase
MIAGKYRIERLVASGGMGLVYRAWQPLLDRRVALKIVRPELLQHDHMEARFLTEARVLAKLETEHVCRVLDGGKLDDGAPYMVLEYLDGADLRTVLNDAGCLEIPRCVDLVLQLLEPLAEMHAMGMVHRDIKPENLFVTRTKGRSECIKLLDFGICGTRSDFEAEAQAEEILGSPQYMPPEQLATPCVLDERGDIWSVGVVLYELVTGQVPFDGESLPAIYGQILARPTPDLRAIRPEAPAELNRVIQRCLAKQPSDRFANVGELAAALAPLGADHNRVSVERVRNTLKPPSPDTPPPLPQATALRRGSTTVRRKAKSTRAFPRLAAALLAGALLGAATNGMGPELPLLRDVADRAWPGAPERLQAFVTNARSAFASAVARYETLGLESAESPSDAADSEAVPAVPR